MFYGSVLLQSVAISLNIHTLYSFKQNIIYVVLLNMNLKYKYIV